MLAYLLDSECLDCVWLCDSDLEPVMVGRRIRIDCIKDKIKTHVLSRVTSNILDLQAAISEGERLTKIFSDVVCPIFMLDDST